MKDVKVVGLLSVVAGILMVIAGDVTYATVSSQLSAENIVVPDDARRRSARLIMRNRAHQCLTPEKDLGHGDEVIKAQHLVLF